MTTGYGSVQAATTTFTYQNGLLVRVVDPDGNVTTFGYDSQGRLTSMTDPLGNTARRTYNTQGQLASITNRDGLRRDFAYNTQGQLATETWYAADGITVTDTLRYTYNAQGLLASASNNSGTYTFSYDDQGRVISVTEPFGISLTFGYDSQGNRTLVQDSFGGTTRSTFNTANQLVSRLFTQQGGPSLQVTLGYDAWGQLTSQTRATNGSVVSATAISHDLAGRITSIIAKNGSGSIIDDFESAFDAAGQLTTETDNGQTQSYNYDLIGQLTSDGTSNYAFDPNGNRNTPGNVIGAGNRLLSETLLAYPHRCSTLNNLSGKELSPQATVNRLIRGIRVVERPTGPPSWRK